MTNKQISDSSNGNGKNNSATQVKDMNTVWVPPEPIAPPPPAFEPDNQPIILERPSWWSHAFVWVIVSVTGFGLLWAGFAPIEQSVPATGKLEAEGAAKEIKAPNGGVVKDVLVKDGELVTKGQLLITFDPTAPNADLESLLKQKKTLEEENKFYNSQFNGLSAGGSPELQALLKSKIALMNENQYYQALISGRRVQGAGNDEFLANQQGLLEANRQEIESRVLAAQLQIKELETQLQQVQAQLSAASRQVPLYAQQLLSSRDRLETAKIQLVTATKQLPMAERRSEMAKRLLATDESLYARIQPVVKQGALSALQGVRQEQQILQRQSEVQQSEADVLTRRQEIQATQGEIASRQGEVASREAELERAKAELTRLQKDQERLDVEINRAKQQLQNAIALSARDVRTKIASNQQRIAEIDSQLARLRLENQKRLDEITGQLQKAQQAVEYQELRSPVAGIVFNLKPTGPGYVVRQIDAEPVLTIVPNDNLVASVNLTNRDVGFIKEGMPVEVSIEPFPSTEFGTIQGKVESIGKDVLKPTQERPFYAFPVKIKLDRQVLTRNGKDYNLQSGMAANASIKVRNRTVLSIFTELFQKQVDSLESVR